MDLRQVAQAAGKLRSELIVVYLCFAVALARDAIAAPHPLPIVLNGFCAVYLLARVYQFWRIGPPPS